jgi:dTDP-4-dehydrorhamnose 3,5-epimerase
MNIISTELPDVYIIEPHVYRDERGYFFETLNVEKHQEKIGAFNIVQSNQPKSKRSVIRGLYQKPPFTQAKIVSVVKGSVLDVIVDIRTDFPTFGQWMSVLLDSTNKLRLYVPRGFAHGFITLLKDAIFQYIVDNAYAPKYEAGIRFDGKTLKIDWKLRARMTVNQKNKLLSTFRESVFNTKAEYNYNSIQIQHKDDNIKRSWGNICTIRIEAN